MRVPFFACARAYCLGAYTLLRRARSPRWQTRQRPNNTARPMSGSPRGGPQFNPGLAAAFKDSPGVNISKTIGRSRGDQHAATNGRLRDAARADPTMLGSIPPNQLRYGSAAYTAWVAREAGLELGVTNAELAIRTYWRRARCPEHKSAAMPMPQGEAPVRLADRH